MPEYKVSWEIEVTAENPRDAAEQVLKIQQDQDSLAKVFFVQPADDTDHFTIDLMDDCQYCTSGGVCSACGKECE